MCQSKARGHVVERCLLPHLHEAALVPPQYQQLDRERHGGTQDGEAQDGVIRPVIVVVCVDRSQRGCQQQ
ncbi:hypothetical protein, partial [Streptococcus mitis]|uniref:hypothetical protein n=1 Tax=Streptococcus mitis TaxID=28037 RepID=UPI0021BAEF40